MDSDIEKFTKLVEIEIVSTSILVGFFFSMVLTMVERYRTDQLGGVQLPFVGGWVSLQAGIVIGAYLTLLFFFVFVVMNVVTLERLVFEKWENAKELHRWSLVVLGLASTIGAITLTTFSVLVVPMGFVNPLLYVMSWLLFIIIFIVIPILVIVKVIQVVSSFRERKN